MEENGSNYSLGQKSQICLARAMLKQNNKILIMDEATAAIDQVLDNLIQYSIKTHFKRTTILTIAHRLNTIIDYDKVIVMEEGKIIEFDSPKNLLDNNNSLFTFLLKQTGEQNFKLLFALANNIADNTDINSNDACTVTFHID